MGVVLDTSVAIDASRRGLGVSEMLAGIPGSPSEEIAIRAGRLDGELISSGLTIGTADAVIAATALELRYSVVTLNGKHFTVVPGLDVVEL